MATTRQAAKFPPTGAGLVAFIDHAMQRGLVQPQLGASYKTTCVEVLPMTLGQGWESTDILAVDLPELLDKFQQIKGRRMPAAGLERYSERLIEAIALFRPYADTPSKLVPRKAPDVEPFYSDSMPDPSPVESEPASPPIIEEDEVSIVDYPEVRPDRRLNGVGDHGFAPRRTDADDADQLAYPFPLRDGVIVTVCLPVDLSKAEARRLAKFLNCLAVAEASAPVPNGQTSPSRRAANPRRRAGSTSSRSSNSTPAAPKRSRVVG